MTKLTIEAAALAKVLADVKDVAAKDAAQPMLSAVLVEVADGTLTARTTNHELEIVRMMPLDAEPCAFCVDARRFSAIMSALPAGAQASLSIGDGRLTVVAGRSRFSLGMIAPEGFPKMPFTGDRNFDAKPDLFQAMAVARPSVATGGAQYWLGGIFIGDRDGKTWIAGTDGNQLTAVSMPALDIGEMILAAATADTIVKMGSECRMSVEQGKVRFDFGSTVVTAKLIDGNYPQFARVIPDVTPVAVSFEGDDMAAALNRIALVADDKDRTVSLVLGDGKMTFSNRSNTDQGSEDVMCDYVGARFEAAFKLGYLRAALAAVDADTAVWHLTDAASPTKIINPKRPAIVAVVMPTR